MITGGSSGVLVQATYTIEGDVETTTYYPEGTTQAQIEAAVPTPSGQTLTVTTVTRYGINVPDWLREENERVVLFGALQEAFTYLQEEDQAAKYLQLFFQEIEAVSYTHLTLPTKA